MLIRSQSLQFFHIWFIKSKNLVNECVWVPSYIIFDRICGNVPNFTLFFDNTLYIKKSIINKILLFYRPSSSFRCEDTAADKQPVYEAIVEKLHSKIDFRLLEQYSVFLRKSINKITSFNNSHAVKCG